MIKEKRDNFADYIKAFLILFVIIGHSIQYGSGSYYLNNNVFYSNIVFKFIYTFHMPLFMIISGYYSFKSINSNSFFYNVKKKVYSIAIPAVIWGIIPLVLFVLLNSELNFSIIVSKIIKYMFSNLWFLWGIIFCYFAVCIIKNFFNDNVYIYIISIIISLFIPNILSVFSYVYPFFILGYQFKKNDIYKKVSKYKKIKLFFAILLVMYLLLLIFFKDNYYIYVSGYSVINKNVLIQIFINLYRFLIGLIGSVLFVSLVKHFYNLSKFKNNKIILFIGRNTLGIYILSGYIFYYVLPYITSNINHNFVVNVFISIVILSFVTFITYIIRKNAFLNSFIFGLNHKDK